MIRHQIARILGAIADRIEPAPPTPQGATQYVYVYSTPPVTTVQPYWQSPWISGSTGTSIN